MADDARSPPRSAGAPAPVRVLARRRRRTRRASRSPSSTWRPATARGDRRVEGPHAERAAARRHARLAARRRRALGAASTPTRELRAYELLDGADLGTPRRIAAVHEPGRTWLFLEAVRGARLEHVGDPAAWGAAARWLARAHATLTARAGRAAAGRRCWSPPWTSTARCRARRRARRPAAHRCPLAPRSKPPAPALAAAPLAVIHGELYAANVLIDTHPRPPACARSTGRRSRAGPALLDLAALTAGSWDDRRAAGRGVPPGAARPAAGRRASAADLDAARLLTAAHWLAATRRLGAAAGAGARLARRRRADRRPGRERMTARAA